MITQEDIKLLDRILAFKSAGSQEAQLMTQFIRKYIDPKVYPVCGHCSDQIRRAHARIKTWAYTNEIEITKARYPEKKKPVATERKSRKKPTRTVKKKK